MIAIVESGSTKSEWVILNEQGGTEANFKTQGFNPYFHNSEFVQSTLDGCADLDRYKKEITKLYFYGAGCSSPELNGIVESGLRPVFSNAEVKVEHDLLAAVYALYEGEPLVCGILGTGSNSCYFDGEKVIDALPSLGFIMGDEASGSYICKRMIRDYFYKRLPDPIQQHFADTFDLSWGKALDKIYGNQHANVYLASFMPFFAQYKEHEYVQKIVRESIGEFIDIHVRCFSSYGKHKVGFVGSIASVFSDILKEELEARNMTPGRIIRNPIRNLVDYHLKYAGVLQAK